MIVAHLIVSLLSGGVPLVAILGVFTMVGVIVVCVVVLTGPVYYNKHDSNGILKQWSAANKVAAVILLVLFTAGFGFVAYQILTAK